MFKYWPMLTFALGIGISVGRISSRWLVGGRPYVIIRPEWTINLNLGSICVA